MKCFLKVGILTTTLFFVLIFEISGQEYDLLIQNGHLIDPKNKIDQIMDVAIKDGKEIGRAHV